MPAADPLATLERSPLRAYYLLFGDETWLVERALGVLRARLLPAGRPGTWRTLWADEQAEALAGALADLASPSLFGGSQVLVVRHAEALRDAEQALLLETLPRLGAGGALILVARAADQRRKLFATMLQAGAGVGFPPLPNPAAAHPWVGRLARERGHDIAPAAVQELVERSGADLGLLAGEVEKLSLHAGPGVRIEPQHVRAVVAAVRSHGDEELTDRLARRDLAGAARVLRLLLAEGEPPIRLVAFVAANLRRALHVVELAEQGLGTEEIGRRLGMPPWLVQKNERRGRSADLVRALLALRRLDVRLKSTRAAEAAFDAALLEIAGTGPGA
ncbi:MAG TPA: DNA polymerase III subunit delta [Candidatus Binatia bacterium]|nr:DNA polymerase III subunit delta [Candidatus Binatia bacterium]